MSARILLAFASFTTIASCSQGTTEASAPDPNPTQVQVEVASADDNDQVTQSRESLKRDADRIRDQQVGPNARVVEERVFFGDFNGDGAEDAVAHYIIDGQPAATTVVPGPIAMVMVNDDGQLEFVRAQPVAGDNPRDAQFSNGSVTLTTDQNGTATPNVIPTS